MDKETLSNYGWIVICVLVLAVMLALATPFGTFVADAIKSTTQGLFDVNQSALNSTGLINIDGQQFENCDHAETEIRNVTDVYTGDTYCKTCGIVMSAGQTVRAKVPEGGKYTAADGTVYNPGDEMPEVVTTGDIYTYEDYEYRYNQLYSAYGWNTSNTQNGWGVKAISNQKETYGAILRTIASRPVTAMSFAFNNSMKLSDLSTIIIPDTITNMDGAFYWCSKIVDASTLSIPEGVISMKQTFSDCGKLTKAPRMPDSVEDMTSTFASCVSLANDGLPNIPKNIQNMSTTFSACTSLTDVSNLNFPENAINMRTTFYCCNNLSGTVKIPCTATTSSSTVPNTVTITYYHVGDCNGSCGK